ncbi:MAG: hypothetical protein ACRDHW_13365 [Ktedonobacteraceae bacterium]
MSTRSVIARPYRSGIQGRYCHWDGYPSGVGKTLYRLNQGHFQGDTVALVRVLIDEHPAGWSFIVGADFSLEPRWVECDSSLPDDHPDRNRPQCYCHGDRSEEAMLLTYPGGTGGLCDAEYVYVIGEHSHIMLIYVVGGSFFHPRLNFLATVQLNGPEPDWNLWGH